MTGFRLGAYAEYRCMKESDSRQHGCLAAKPKNLSHEEGHRGRVRRLAGAPVLRCRRHPAFGQRDDLWSVRDIWDARRAVRQASGSTSDRCLRLEERRLCEVARCGRGPGLHPWLTFPEGGTLRLRPRFRRRHQDLRTQGVLQARTDTTGKIRVDRRWRSRAELGAPGRLTRALRCRGADSGARPDLPS